MKPRIFDQVSGHIRRLSSIFSLPDLIPTFFTFAALLLIVALLLAVNWSTQSFPGYLVEPTLVVLGAQSPDWSGPQAGLAYPMRVTHINGRYIASSGEFLTVAFAQKIGDQTTIRVELPDRSRLVLSNVVVDQFPIVDFWRLFALPYSLAVLYLAIGNFVYRQRAELHAVREFAKFCINAAIVLGLMFDNWTTHIGTVLYSVALAWMGTSMIRLAFYFPVAWPPIQRNPWLGWLPVGISAGLIIWGLPNIFQARDPWYYITVWRIAYIYVAVSILVFLGIIISRLVIRSNPIVHRMVQILSLGSFLAFAPIAAYSGSSLFGVYLEWKPALFLPLLVSLPVSIMIAMLRYQLWELNHIIKRTLVYAVLTASLVGVYFLLILMVQQLFFALSRENQPMIVAISTVLTAALFYPSRKAAQRIVDKRFGYNHYDADRIVAEFSSAMRYEVNLDALIKRLIMVIENTLHPIMVNVYTTTGGSAAESLSSLSSSDALYQYLQMTGDALFFDEARFSSEALAQLQHANFILAAPLISQEELVAILTLGAPAKRSKYDGEDMRLLELLCSQAAPAMRVAQIVRQQEADLAMRQMIQQEMHLATIVQQTLLPQAPPNLPGWDVGVRYLPARAVSGDFYDFFLRPDGKLVLVIGDVTDKGVPAALVMATIRSILRGQMREQASPGKALQVANELIWPEMLPNMFITCFYIVLDLETGELEFANAGHNLPILCRGEVVQQLDARGMPLGLMPYMSYDEHKFIIEADDRLLLFTDGLVEAHNPQGEMFGSQRLLTQFHSAVVEWGKIEGEILTALRKFTGEKYEQEDDITLLCLRKREEKNAFKIA
jgi:serine phosphatase RsbU (regulator of sigma subunit)